MEKIEVVYRELSPGLNVYHQFILYTNSAGVQYAASGWPETKLSGGNGIGTGFSSCASKIRKSRRILFLPTN